MHDNNITNYVKGFVKDTTVTSYTCTHVVSCPSSVRAIHRPQSNDAKKTWLMMGIRQTVCTYEGGEDCIFIKTNKASLDDHSFTDLFTSGVQQVLLEKAAIR